jgi:arylsulfatase A-like enzyme
MGMDMRDRAVYGLLILVLSLFRFASNSFGESPPNIVMFLVDDLGATDLGCFGSTFYETPHLDKLAAGGMRFTAAYSACPVCSPTRASIMTGRYPQRTGITDYIGSSNQPDKWSRNTRLLPTPNVTRLALEERTIAEALREVGYVTFFAGKWHLGNKGFLPTDQGFQINKGGFNAGSPRSYFSPYRNPYLNDGPPGESLSLRLAEEACHFIEANSGRPFFAYVSFYSVHIPLQAPQELIRKYEAKAASLKVSGPASTRERESDVRLVQNHPTYAAMIEEMDTAVGTVLNKLESLGLDKKTVVVFTSDNGGLATAEGRPTSNVPLRAGKGWLYEGGIRVPTIVRWPGFAEAGSTCTTPIISNDYFPTFMEVVHQPLKPGREIDGVSVVPLLRGEQLEPRPLYWHYPHYGNQGGSPGAAVRNGRWKLIEWYEDDPRELYDLEADPSEKTNLAVDRPDVVERLAELLVNWRREVGAKMPIPNPRYHSGE